ncbi:MAG TPA: lytic transglycosylase domain-containing protein [Acetobacteraceae bacterium]|nr:lytic transglycosylase domain-containing protein [Acetobacteraceae bacterium]
MFASFALTVSLFAAAPCHAGANNAAPGAACISAIAAAGSEEGVPAGLLLAIGRVETGRRSAAMGQIAPWPWSIDADGMGRFLSTETQAIDAVRTLQEQGVSSIDVGCMQVNLQQHPDAFASLEQAFAPVTNADYAARFLRALFSETGNWIAAVAAYHSRTPDLAAPYQRLVLNAWYGDGAFAPGWPVAAMSPRLGAGHMPGLRPFSPSPLPATSAGSVDAAPLLRAMSACLSTAPADSVHSWSLSAAAPCRRSPFASTARLMRVLSGKSIQ